jgi:hypothetical protein
MSYRYSNHREWSAMGILLQPSAVVTATTSVTTGPTPPLPQVLGAEIVQSIQSLKHDVPLIRGKATIARVYISTAGLAPHTALRGDIAVSDTPGGPARYVSSANAIQTSAGPAPSLAAMRAATDESLNFILPSETLTGSSVSVRLNRLYDSGGDVPFDDAPAVTATLVDGAPLYVHAVGLRYIWRKPDGSSTTVTPEASFRQSPIVPEAGLPDLACGVVAGGGAGRPNDHTAVRVKCRS